MAIFADGVTRLYPAWVRTTVMPVVEVGLEPACAAEGRLVSSATARRRREFAAGRACAHAGLQALGAGDGPIGMGSAREPLWPPGVVGSISHAGTVAGAAVGRDADAWSLGLDIECLDPPLCPDVERLIHADPGKPRPGGHLLERHRTKIAFSAKECVFKCLYPRTRWLLDFVDVSVSIDLGARRYTAAVSRRFRVPGPDVGVLDGQFAIRDGYIFTSLCIPAASPWTGAANAAGPDHAWG